VGESVSIGGSPTSDLGGSTYLWSPGETLDDSTSANPEASPEATTIYTVTVTNLLGCSNSQSMTVVVNTGFEYPTGFTPNGDGDNDTWQLDFLSKYPDCRVEIYNRWGQMVFDSDGYLEAWDGTFEGEDLPVGTYYYVIDLGREDISKPLTGPITILR
jgi:gliding motility-associated-like protein